MNKLFTKIASIALGLSMAIGVGVAVSVGRKDASPALAAGTDTTEYQLINSTDSLETGKSYIITNGTSGTVKAISNATNANNRKTTSVTVTNNKITRGSSVMSFTLGGSSGAWTFEAENYITSGELYLASAASGKNNYLRLIATAGTATISFSGDAAVIIIGPHSSRNIIRYNTSDLFACYSSGQEAVYLWKEVVVQKYTVSFAVNTAGYGTLSSSSITNVPSGSSITVSNNQVTINETTITATPSANTAQYSYAFTGWTYNGGDVPSTVTSAITITANFSRTTRTYDVTGSITNGSLTVSGQIAYGGSLDVTLVPTSGHGYPESSSDITVSGATISAYNNSTGVISLSSATGAVTVTATCPALGNTYSITTNISGGTHSGDTSITDNGGVASVTIAATGDHKLPSAAVVDETTYISVSGASFTYNSSTGVISLSNATANVVIDVTCPDLTSYTITVIEPNGTHTGASTILEGRTATLTFTPNSGWGQPADVTVSGATKSWVRNTGVLTLSNPTGNVSVTYSAAANELTSITLSATSGSYTLGDAFVKPTVTAHYSVSSDANVTNSATYSGYNPYATGSQTVTISYTDGGITKTATYTATVSAASVQTTTYYQKCTSMSDIVNGGKYVLIGYKEATTTYYAMPSYSSGNNIQGATVTLTENETRLTEANMSTAAVYTLTSTGTTNQYYIGDGSQYLYAAGSGTNNYLKGKASTDSSAGAFTISYSTFFSVVAASSNRNTMRFNASNNPPIFSCYANNDNQTEIMFFKEVKEQTGSADLIRITASYNGGEKYVGDPISASDFTVKKQLNTGNELIDVASGYTIDANTLTSTSNNITVTYTEGVVTKTAIVVVSATEREASLEHVVLNVGENAKLDGYVYWSGAEWDLADITVTYDWDDDDFDETVDLQDLVDSGDATLSPATPTLGATSFTVSYSYLEKNIENATVTLDEAVVADYVSSVSWGGKSLAHFKAFSGQELTASTVNSWTVKATYAGAGETNALSFGTGANQFTIRIGDSKAVTSLPYTWTTADDNQFVYVVIGGVAKGDSTYAKTNICATINAIDHSETTTGEIEKSVTWSKDDSIAAYGTTSLCDDGVALDENIFMQGAKGGAGTEIRFWSDGIRTYTGGNTLTFTPSNGAVITKITLPTVAVTSDSTSSASSPYTITDGDSPVVFDIGSKSTIGSDIVVEYTIEGSVTTKKHYANDMDHFDAQKKVVEFAKFMNNTMNGTNVCSGTFANLESAWDDVAGKYDELFGASTTLNETELAWAKNMLKYASAQWGSDEEAACVEKAMKTYDHCVTQYSGTCTAFMSEVRSVNPAVFNPLTSIKSNGNAIAIITVISLISVSAVGGYFFLRKRKED